MQNPLCKIEKVKTNFPIEGFWFYPKTVFGFIKRNYGKKLSIKHRFFPVMCTGSILIKPFSTKYFVKNKFEIYSFYPL